MAVANYEMERDDTMEEEGLLNEWLLVRERGEQRETAANTA